MWCVVVVLLSVVILVSSGLGFLYWVYRFLRLSILRLLSWLSVMVVVGDIIEFIGVEIIGRLNW